MGKSFNFLIKASAASAVGSAFIAYTEFTSKPFAPTPLSYLQYGIPLATAAVSGIFSILPALSSSLPDNLSAY